MKKLEKLTNIIEALLFVNGKAVAIEDIAVNLGVTEKEITDAAKDKGTLTPLELKLVKKSQYLCYHQSHRGMC